MATNPIDWNEIQNRYLQGERPKDIAKDFGLTARQISDKVTRSDWKRKKTEIRVKIAQNVEQHMTETAMKATRVLNAVLDYFLEPDGSLNLYACDRLSDKVFLECLRKALPEKVDRTEVEEERTFQDWGQSAPA